MITPPSLRYSQFGPISFLIHFQCSNCHHWTNIISSVVSFRFYLELSYFSVLTGERVYNTSEKPFCLSLLPSSTITRSPIWTFFDPWIHLFLAVKFAGGTHGAIYPRTVVQPKPVAPHSLRFSSIFRVIHPHPLQLEHKLIGGSFEICPAVGTHMVLGHPLRHINAQEKAPVMEPLPGVQVVCWNRWKYSPNVSHDFWGPSPWLVRRRILLLNGRTEE